MKIKIVVLNVQEIRKKYMQKQVEEMGISSIFEIEYYDCFIPENSVEYINYKDEKNPEHNNTICCCRSYFSVFEKYSKLDYDYVITFEDDISILKLFKDKFKDRINDIIKIWEKYEDIEYVNLGYNLSIDYKQIKDTKNEDNFYYDVNLNNLWGCQMLLLKKNTLIKLSKYNVSTALEFINLINSNKDKTYANKYKRIQTDAILPLLCKGSLVYPPLAIENNEFNSSISGEKNSQHKLFKLHPEINFSLFYKEKKYNKVIGITFSVPDKPVSMFSNGHRQNVLYLFEVFFLLGYDVYLILDKPLIDGLYNFNYKKYKTLLYDDLNAKLNPNFDIVFQFGFNLDTDFMIKLKQIGCKIILYKCSFDYVLDMESTLFSYHEQNNIQCPPYNKDSLYDEVWCIPQMETLNYYYWEILYRCPVTVIPFVWSNKTIENLSKMHNLPNDGVYTPKEKTMNKKIAIFEPNLNVTKCCLPCVLICENVYRSKPEYINHVYITNTGQNIGENINTAHRNFNHKYFTQMLYSLDLYIDKKLSSETRYQTITFMNSYADIAVSHQWGNPLNYLYLELAWMGWPVLHNGSLCADVGYYYEGFNYKQASKILEDIIETHDKNANYYIKRNRDLIDRYLPTNIKLQNTYKELIDRL